MSAYAPWLIPAGIAFAALVAYHWITASNRIDNVLQQAFDEEKAK